MEIVPMSRWLFWFNLWTLVFRNGGNDSIRATSFSKTTSCGRRFDLKTHSNVRSRIECAKMCFMDWKADQGCQGFWYHSLDKKCNSYTTGTNFVLDPGVELFGLKTQRQPNNTWNIVNVNGRQFSVHFDNLKLNFYDARRHCCNLGGYLLEFDSLDEYEAVKLIFENYAPTSEFIFVGANDLENEGTWVTDREIVPFNHALWLWYMNQPNNLNNEEDCGAVNHQSKIYDRPCDDVTQFLCEQDIL